VAPFPALSDLPKKAVFLDIRLFAPPRVTKIKGTDEKLDRREIGPICSRCAKVGIRPVRRPTSCPSDRSRPSARIDGAWHSVAITLSGRSLLNDLEARCRRDCRRRRYGSDAPGTDHSRTRCQRASSTRSSVAVGVLRLGFRPLATTPTWPKGPTATPRSAGPILAKHYEPDLRQPIFFEKQDWAAVVEEAENERGNPDSSADKRRPTSCG
jgi:hypothetical protein